MRVVMILFRRSGRIYQSLVLFLSLSPLTRRRTLPGVCVASRKASVNARMIVSVVVAVRSSINLLHVLASGQSVLIQSPPLRRLPSIATDDGEDDDFVVRM